MVSFRFIQAFQAFWQFRETKVFFQCQRAEPRETRDSSLSARLKSENEKKMQLSKSWKFEAAQKDLYGLIFFLFGGCTVLEQHRKECESKT